MDEKLLRFLACPACKGDVAPSAGEDFLLCRDCKLKYPVIEGIPVMLVDEAHPLVEEEDGEG